MQTTRRATPLSVEDRQSMIVDAVIPLLLTHGRAVTSRQIADAAGVAEGTIFRAFGDKDAVIAAALERFFDPEPMRAALRTVSPDQPLEAKVQQLIVILRDRFRGIIGMMAILGERERPPHRGDYHQFEDIISTALAPDAATLGWSGARIAQVLRILAFSSAIPGVAGDDLFSVEELTHIVLYGVTGLHPDIRRN